MDYEKKYKEALKKAKEWYNVNDATEDEKALLRFMFPELAETEDEKIRKELLAVINDLVLPDEQQSRFIAWLEKQGVHANFRNKIQIGDKVTRNEDGVLVNLSQLKRVAKKDEKQDEQKSYASETMNEKWDFDSGFTRMMEKEQKHAAWSEEDDRMMNDTLAMVDWYAGKHKNISVKVGNWLKSLKERYTWRPSDNELEVLRLAAEKDGACLMGLYQQLKKLRGE